jgi:glycosyltransferase involved in cell wall biosynthesis
MRILQLCNKPPNPAKDGGCIAMNNITNGLIDSGHEVQILTIETHKHPLVTEKLSDKYKEDTEIQSVFVDTKVNLVDAFSNLVTSDSYNISRFFSTDFDLALIHILRKKKFDIIHLESLFMTPYINTIRRYSKAKVVLRSHNLEYMIWERMASGSKNVAKRAYLGLLARQLKKYELSVINEVDGIAAISSEDAKKYAALGCETPMITIPFGIDLHMYMPKPEKCEFPTLFHLGSMDWSPNIEGVNWFLENSWETINKELPDLKLYLAGRNMPKWLMESDIKNVEVIGEINSAANFMNSKSVMLVPLLSAGGMRVKIIEGMALGKTIISTRIGAEGIDYEDMKNIVIADTPEDYVNTVKQIVSDENLCKTIGKNARTLVEEKYDNKLLTENLVYFYRELIQS